MKKNQLTQQLLLGHIKTNKADTATAGHMKTLVDMKMKASNTATGSPSLPKKNHQKGHATPEQKPQPLPTRSPLVKGPPKGQKPTSYLWRHKPGMRLWPKRLKMNWLH